MRRFLELKKGLVTLPWVLALLAAAFLVTFHYGIGANIFFEIVSAVRHQYSAWQIEEFLVALVAVSVALLCVAIYRGLTLGREVKRRKSAEEAALRLARHDSLTGLLNRDAFLEEAEKQIRGAKGGQYAVLFVDLDKFKVVNDVHGHGAGDAVITQVAARISEIGKQGLVARVGGDEFVLFIKRVPGRQSLVQISHQLSRAIEQAIPYERVSLVVKASIGISMSAVDQSEVETLVRTADIAMYKAKKRGGRQFQFFEEWMDAEIQQQAGLREELRRAIAEGQIVPFLQPFINFGTGEIAGFEALARWRHPVIGLMTPDKFIALAEEEGLVGELFFSVLRQSCREALKWSKPVSVAINLSPIQLTDSTLAEAILRVLARMKFDPRRLEIEVTESALVEDCEVANRTLTKLRTAGVCISLDDFGTGFSSLYQLKEMPFDKIKLDRSFVGNSATDPKNRRYVSAIVSFGTALGLRMTAEGIEDEATAQWLKALGCTYGQGYLFSKPVTTEIARTMVREDAARKGAAKLQIAV